jgi:hypothetical protein
MKPLYIIKIQENLIDFLMIKLTPCIFEGILSIYNKSKEVSNCEDILKNFQIFLSKIKYWSENMLAIEVHRILNIIGLDISSMSELLNLIIKFKKYIYNCGKNFDNDISGEKIDVKIFIHDIYKNIANDLYINPFLLYDKNSPNEIKQNILIVQELICKKINEKLNSYIEINCIIDNLKKINLEGGNNDNINESSEQLRGIIHNELFKMNDNFNSLLTQLQPVLEPVLEPLQNQVQPVLEPLQQPLQNQVQPVLEPLQQPLQIQKIYIKEIQDGGNNKNSPENVINNDKIEINEIKREKLSSSENIKAIENEINNKIDKSIDLIKKLDNDRNEIKNKGGNNSDSSSSDYNTNTENIEVYSNSNTINLRNKNGLFIKQNLKKTIPKYENIII